MIGIGLLFASEPEVVRRHAGYRNRVLMGPSFRADAWTVLERARI